MLKRIALLSLLTMGCGTTAGEVQATGPLGQQLIVINCNGWSCKAMRNNQIIASDPVMSNNMANALAPVPAARRHLTRARAAFGAAIGLTVPTAFAFAFGGIIGFDERVFPDINNRTAVASGLLLAGAVLFAADLYLTSVPADEISRAVQAYNLAQIRRIEGQPPYFPFVMPPSPEEMKQAEEKKE